jgi:RNA polymerase sigma factor (TIGR02999 family)
MSNIMRLDGPGSTAVLTMSSVTAEERRELDRLYTATYEELRRLAASVRRGSSLVTLSPTTLVNEAWMKLAGSPGVASTSRLHFKRIAARAMRQVLVEAARRKTARKRGGGTVVLVTLDDSVVGADSRPEEVLALDAALEDLSKLEPRQAQMVECRFFAGLDVAETAQVLQVSEATIHRDWRAAKAWLGSAIRKGGGKG